MADLSSLIKKPEGTSTKLDQKIVIRFIKTKPKGRTYVRGLNAYFSETECTQFVTKMKTSLGTGCSTETIDGETEYGFQGNWIKVIKENLLKDGRIEGSKIVSV